MFHGSTRIQYLPIDTCNCCSPHDQLAIAIIEYQTYLLESCYAHRFRHVGQSVRLRLVDCNLHATSSGVVWHENRHPLVDTTSFDG